jgi:L-ascorbate metabolism protein UlaG (beta-lactamase superfamily)
MSAALRSIPIDASFFEKQEGTTLTWLGMAGVLINSRGVIILIDPLITSTGTGHEQISESGYRLKIPLPIQAKEVPRADFVLYTHADDDHFGETTAKTFIERHSCPFLVTPPVRQRLSELGASEERLCAAREFEILHVGSAEIIVTPALHDWQTENPWKREDCCGFLIRTPDGTIWHPGDTRLIDELFTVKDVDVLFFDVAAVESHLGPQGSAQLAMSCGAKILIAYHYGTLDLPPGSFGGCDPDDALPALQNTTAKFIRLNPGELLYLKV